MKNSTKAVLLVGGVSLLVLALNFVFFVDTKTSEEDERNGDRSSYHSTPYGTMAYYTLLEESGVPVMRLERPFTELHRYSDLKTLIVIAPPLKFNPSAEEFKSVNQWVEDGGLLIIIDREISIKIESDVSAETLFGSSAASPAVPLQPTSYTRGVKRVALSDYATHIQVDSRSTINHIGDASGAVLADATAGKGRVVLLTDPFVVANNGIAQEDNVALAMNLLEGCPDGRVAFDEYHHGYSSGGLLGGGTGVLGYFTGTPIPWMMAQAGLIGILFVFTRGRRFARALPLKRDRRTTTLEFVSSMATIARLARASALAMENIYSEFRRRLCRYSSLPAGIETRRLATAVARRAKLQERGLAQLLLRCEEVARGARVSESEMVSLVGRIREIESALKV